MNAVGFLFTAKRPMCTCATIKPGEHKWQIYVLITSLIKQTGWALPRGSAYICTAFQTHT